MLIKNNEFYLNELVNTHKDCMRKTMLFVTHLEEVISMKMHVVVMKPIVKQTIA